uniref:15,16-dihydrobiliverdin:ferredoxin oxidoreductase n=1 Tax=Amphora coffeiformis TaxID=265554 RepID=A0A7S3LH46_9STRA|eukprot:scaffold2026_cov176-Amphora_coffeaeformis.AAC.8
MMALRSSFAVSVTASLLLSTLLSRQCAAFAFQRPTTKQGLTTMPLQMGRGMTMDLETPNVLRQGSSLLKSTPFAVSKPVVRTAPLDENQRSVRQAEISHGMPWRSSIDPTYAGDGPYYMKFWEWQMNFMKEQLTNLRALPTTSSTGKDMSYVENSQDHIRMHTLQFQSDEYQLIRLTLLDAGNKTQVFTSLWYPDASYNLPVLGVDFLLFNNVKHLCISDFQPIHDTEASHDAPYEHLMEPIRSQFPSLQGKMTKRFYDENQHFSSQMLLARQEDPDIVRQMMEHELPVAFQGYLRTHVQLVKSTKPQPHRAHEIRARYRAYDKYSSVRDPAHGLLARYFGSEFADEYVYDILFPQSQEPDE